MFLFGCPSSRERDPEIDAAVGDADAGRTGNHDASRDARPDYDVFVDPGCSGDAAAVDPTFLECDPYDATSCPDGTACYPQVIYPDGPCARSVLATECVAAGTGDQDVHCYDRADCAAGHTCFLTGAGNRCLQLCDQGGGEPRCPRGRICGFTDIPGYGACF